MTDPASVIREWQAGDLPLRCPILAGSDQQGCDVGTIRGEEGWPEGTPRTTPTSATSPPPATLPQLSAGTSHPADLLLWTGLFLTSHTDMLSRCHTWAEIRDKVNAFLLKKHFCEVKSAGSASFSPGRPGIQDGTWGKVLQKPSPKHALS